MARFLSAGDTAVTVELRDQTEIDIGVSHAVLELYGRVREARLDGVIDVIPALHALTVFFDPNLTTSSELSGALALLLSERARPGERGRGPGVSVSRRWLIPACYEPEFAPDIDVVARHGNLQPWQVTALHACVDYRVLMLGFLPGHPYMGELPPPLQVPRRDDPRTSVAAGSIAIATTMTVIYPLESPGGWHIIGRTPVPLFDPKREPATLLEPGDEIRFRSISADEFRDIAGAVGAGTWTPTSIAAPSAGEPS